MQLVIFTDLDSTLLEYGSYSYAKAMPAIQLVKRRKIPIVICTSKTRSEIEFYRKAIGIKEPFISENGGAVFIPKGYFKTRYRYDYETKNYFVIQLGDRYETLVNVLNKLKKTYRIKGFSDMSIKEISKMTGLSPKRAKLAKQREYDEPFITEASVNEKAMVKDIKKTGLNCFKGGRFWHLIGKTNKGKAVKIVINLYKKEHGKIKSVGLGDSANDFQMLNAVDIPYLVMGHNRRYASKKYLKAGAIGPEGWRRAVEKVIKEND